MALRNQADIQHPESKKRQGEGTSDVESLYIGDAGLIVGAAPALAAVEQCRFILARADREACYARQATALAAKRKPEQTSDTKTIESLQEMRREDDEVYKSLRSICRGC
jgi:glutamine amidotransferase PdxT